MRVTRFTWPAAALLLAACSDPLNVDNTNNPDRATVYARPADVEALAGNLFQQINQGTLGTLAGSDVALRVMAFENSSALANNGLGPRGALPRSFIANTRANAYDPENLLTFNTMQRTARTASNIIAAAAVPSFGTVLGSEPRLARLRAFTWFAYGTALANAALMYDSAAVPRPADNLDDLPPLESAAAVMTVALQALDTALAYAALPAATQTGGFPLPTAWLRGNPLTRDDFVRVVRSHKARFRAGVARTPEQRAAVNWQEVIADARAGITADFTIDMDPASSWDVAWLAATLHFRDANWHQVPNYIIGMADSSGAYDAWLATPRDQRLGFLIQTRDRRFPSGSARAAQNAVGQGVLPDTVYYRNRAAGLDNIGTAWQNSQYDHYRWRAFSTAARVGRFPVMPKGEIDMLQAEGLLRTNQVGAAIPLINTYRTRNNLPAIPTSAGMNDQVPGGRSCVPRVPVGPTFTTTQCGSVFEAMKWEKRMETHFTFWGAWFWDARGWGDLPEGTALEFPVPWQEMDTRLTPFYNLGGAGGRSAARVSTYGFGSGQR